MNALLCYEVWHEASNGTRQLVSSYWDVQDAWAVAQAINTTCDGAAEVGVASGLERVICAPGGECESVVRSDVIGERTESRKLAWQNYLDATT